MIINDYTPSEDIFRNMLIELINKRKITIEALETITSLSAQWFKKYINRQCSLDSLLESEKHFLTDLIILLTDGNTIDCDSRLKGIIDVLLQIYKFDLSTLGNCIIRFTAASCRFYFAKLASEYCLSAPTPPMLYPNRTNGMAADSSYLS